MPIILNKKELSTNPLREAALEILEAGLEAVQTERILRNKIILNDKVLNIEKESFDLRSFKRIFFVGIGKCALDGAKVTEEMLGDYLMGGIAIDARNPKEANLKKIKYFQGTHPLPSRQNVKITLEALEMLENLSEDDLVICLISGGGSALFELPIPGMTIEQIISKTEQLTDEGADIYELNRMRKRMSQVKGGKLVQFIKPARIISLIFSDVLGNDISVVASGPTVAEGAENILLCSNRDALVAMRVKAGEFGFDAKIETETFSGNASRLGKELALKKSKPKTCLLFGGETTVKIPQNHGVGGRNQEMALSALLHMPPDSVLVCAASDGWDNTDHAGAIVDKELFEKVKTLGIFPEGFLMRGDSYNFYKRVEDGAILTGKLGSNVSDLYIMLYK